MSFNGGFKFYKKHERKYGSSLHLYNESKDKNKNNNEVQKSNMLSIEGMKMDLNKSP